MNVLYLHNSTTFLILLYAVEDYFSNFCWDFNFKTTIIPNTIPNVQLRCKRVFSESYMAVSLVGVTKVASESLEF